MPAQLGISEEESSRSFNAFVRKIEDEHSEALGTIDGSLFYEERLAARIKIGQEYMQRLHHVFPDGRIIGRTAVTKCVDDCPHCGK